MTHPNLVSSAIGSPGLPILGFVGVFILEYVLAPESYVLAIRSFHLYQAFLLHEDENICGLFLDIWG